MQSEGKREAYKRLKNRARVIGQGNQVGIRVNRRMRERHIEMWEIDKNLISFLKLVPSSGHRA